MHCMHFGSWINAWAFHPLHVLVSAVLVFHVDGSALDSQLNGRFLIEEFLGTE